MIGFLWTRVCKQPIIVLYFESENELINESITGFEVLKLEYSLRLKIKRNDWLLVRKQPIIALYFESENELKF